MQFLATKIYAKKIQEILVIPSSVENFQQEKIDFDLVLSMGVLYHSKAPLAHIETIKKILKKNGSLILETIITNNTKNIYVKKGQSFAGMKNISIIFNEKNVIHLLNSYFYVTLLIGSLLSFYFKLDISKFICLSNYFS